MLGFSPLSSSPLGTPAPGSPIGTGVGKISGPLLAPNLERSGTDFSVDTDLLYLNVNDQRVGFGTDVPDCLAKHKTGEAVLSYISGAYVSPVTVIISPSTRPKLAGVSVDFIFVPFIVNLKPS
jgi:hypothetical protein